MHNTAALSFSRHIVTYFSPVRPTSSKALLCLHFFQSTLTLTPRRVPLAPIRPARPSSTPLQHALALPPLPFVLRRLPLPTPPPQRSGSQGHIDHRPPVPSRRPLLSGRTWCVRGAALALAPRRSPRLSGGEAGGEGGGGGAYYYSAFLRSSWVDLGGRACGGC